MRLIQALMAFQTQTLGSITKTEKQTAIGETMYSYTFKDMTGRTPFLECPSL